MKNQNNFNAIAPFYDGLSTLVFGSKIKKVQIESLSFIPPKSRVLIIGGGTGWILDEIAKVIPTGLTITYMDKSLKMIELSKKRNLAFNRVTFVCGAIEDVPVAQQEYDVLLTPFFLDCFSQIALEAVCHKLDESLKNGGTWIYIDFYLSSQSSFRQKMMVKIMYLFFEFLSQIQAERLPAVDAFFSQYSLISQKTYYNDFIRRGVFRKLS